MAFAIGKRVRFGSRFRRTVFPVLLPGLLIAPAAPARAAALYKVLFLGDQGLHKPAGLDKVIAPVFAAQGVQCDYTEKPSDINKANLAGYDAVLLYNNIDSLPGRGASDLIEFVQGGKGLLVVHCGIVMAPREIRLDTLFGGRFVRHDTATFRAEIIAADHPAMRGVQTFLSWDETYQHRLVGIDRTVLMVRPAPGGNPEPWTWVRTQGKGRMYYTAAGHDTRTWSQPAYQKQLTVALLWVMGKETVGLAPARNRQSMWDRSGVTDRPDGVNLLKGGILRAAGGRLEWRAGYGGDLFDPAGRRAFFLP